VVSRCVCQRWAGGYVGASLACRTPAEIQSITHPSRSVKGVTWSGGRGTRRFYPAALIGAGAASLDLAPGLPSVPEATEVSRYAQTWT
jgi:hypothetical protein